MATPGARDAAIDDSAATTNNDVRRHSWMSRLNLTMVSPRGRIRARHARDGPGGRGTTMKIIGTNEEFDQEIVRKT